MYTVETISRSFVYWLSQNLHPMYEVKEGELYGVNLNNVDTAPASAVVTIQSFEEGYFELGTMAISCDVAWTINSKNKRQRDATSSMLVNSILTKPILVYDNFTQYTPTPDAASRTIQIDNFQLKNTTEPDVANPNLFWVTVLFLKVTISL